jgi:urea transporter
MALSAQWNRPAIEWNRLTQGNVAVGFLDTLLRGTGQVMFQNNPITGALFLVGIFINSWQLGVAGVIGLLSSTLAAIILGADRALIRVGLFGYNGILTGIGLAFFLQLDGVLIGYIVLGGVLSTVVMMALANLFSTRDMPALTAPFVLTTWLLLFAVYLFAHLHATALIQPSPLNPQASVQTDLRPLVTGGVGAGVTAGNLAEGFFRGVGEVFFQDNLWTGLIFLVAILVNSPISAIFAALGSIVGIITAMVFFGGNGFWVYHGLYGFNSVLCAIAIGGIFYVLTWKSALYALLCALVGAVVMASISVLLTPLGMPALTAPFVLTTWLFLLPKAGFRALQPVPLAEVAAPEQVRRKFLEKQRRQAAAPALQQ